MNTSYINTLTISSYHLDIYPTDSNKIYKMLFTTLLAIATISAGPVLGRSSKVRDTRQIGDGYVCDIRVFGETGCFEKNWGVGTLTGGDVDKCFVFDDSGSIKAVNLTNIIDGCSCMFLGKNIIIEST